MKRTTFLLLLILCVSSTILHAQEKSKIQQNAEVAEKSGQVANARSNYIRAFQDYAAKGSIQQSVECGVKATALYYKESLYKEAFELLRNIDQTIYSVKLSDSQRASLRYLTTKERMQMYIKLRKNASALDQLETMEKQAKASGSDELYNDLLYNKAIYYYTFGQNAQGNAVFKEMASKLTAQKEYNKVDEVYQTLIANGRKSNNANMVAQSYNSYVAWKDSVNELKVADITAQLNQKISQHEETIASKDDSLASRKAIIFGLLLLVGILAAVLAVGAIVLVRYIFLTSKQKAIIKNMKANNELKVKFINNISAQLNPTLQKLNTEQPEVKALLHFTNHIEQLSQLENSVDEVVETEELNIQPFCEELAEQIRKQLKPNVQFTVNVPKTNVRINREYVTHILQHLLSNAVYFTQEDGHIRLEFKKRGAHSHQFIVQNTGIVIPEEKREDIFKPFLEIRDLTEGDGLGLPICKQMALKMNGDITVDPEFTKGTRFILSLHD